MRSMITRVLPFVVGCGLVVPSVQAGDDESCTFTMKNCLSSSFMTSVSDEVRVYVWDGDDGVQWVATEDRWFSEYEEKDLSCNHSNCDTRVEGWANGKWRYHTKNNSCKDLWIVEDGSNDFELSTSTGC